ncbi:saccharopine dehydrogenase family protein [Marinicellulosiphila megalodicopiae]|uniref:saccharopine dehydrogenase family protein n=1 Tax=Marinicellulosiphila megalodicopiae TaxID=2724896 RepID=UPI003BB10BF6
MSVKTIVVLGGYGNFGKRISEFFSEDPSLKERDLTVYIAGRNIQSAQNFCNTFESNQMTTYLPLKIDIFADNCFDILQTIQPDLIIHTSGPFQGQDAFIAKYCLQLNCHYIDLADDRKFVNHITDLNKIENINPDLLIVSGASSVPGVSSTVVCELAKQFSELHVIDIAIAPGNQAERGKATLKGILSYTGKPFLIWKNKKWQQVFGWMDSRKVDFKYGIGKRHLANVDVPDLELFPKYFPALKTMTFQAGLELGWLHNIMLLMAKLAKHKWIKNWASYTGIIYYLACKVERFGSGDGAMRVKLSGLNHQKQQQEIIWTLVAKDGIGPFIPTFASLILAKKLILNEGVYKGITPCMNLFSLKEFEDFAFLKNIQSHIELKDK